MFSRQLYPTDYPRRPSWFCRPKTTVSAVSIFLNILSLFLPSRTWRGWWLRAPHLPVANRLQPVQLAQRMRAYTLTRQSQGLKIALVYTTPSPPPVCDVTPLPGVAPKTPRHPAGISILLLSTAAAAAAAAANRLSHPAWLKRPGQNVPFSPIAKRTISYNTTVGARPRGNARTRRSEISVEIEFYDPTQPWRSCAV